MAYCQSPNFFNKIGWTACGKCDNCLKNKRKEWADRLNIEMRYHPYNYFVTLTYSPEFYPLDESLDKKAVQDFKKRLEYYAGYTPRSFCVGEYGDSSNRAHYHAAIFSDKDDFEAIMNAWRLGRVSISRMTPGRCGYIAGYVTKKMTKKDDERLDGRLPEFFLSSRRPALGDGLFLDLYNKMINDPAFLERMLQYTYPPKVVSIGGKKVRLPRYIRDKLAPIYKVYNEEKQKSEKESKFQKDFVLFKKIYQNLLQLQGIDTDVFDSDYNSACDTKNPLRVMNQNLQEMAKPFWDKRKELAKKADNLKNKYRRFL